MSSPLDRGLAHVVGVVLTYSRLTVGLSGAASMTRAAREARLYSEFRVAFGRRIGRFPMVADQIAGFEKSAGRSNTWSPSSASPSPGFQPEACRDNTNTGMAWIVTKILSITQSSPCGRNDGERWDDGERRRSFQLPSSVLLPSCCHPDRRHNRYPGLHPGPSLELSSWPVIPFLHPYPSSLSQERDLKPPFAQFFALNYQ